MQGGLQERTRVDTGVLALLGSKEIRERPDAGFRHVESDDALFLMDFMTARLSPPFGTE
jgi:hypothetical protein